MQTQFNSDSLDSPYNVNLADFSAMKLEEATGEIREALTLAAARELQVPADSLDWESIPSLFEGREDEARDEVLDIWNQDWLLFEEAAQGLFEDPFYGALMDTFQ